MSATSCWHESPGALHHGVVGLLPHGVVAPLDGDVLLPPCGIAQTLVGVVHLQCGVVSLLRSAAAQVVARTLVVAAAIAVAFAVVAAS